MGDQNSFILKPGFGIIGQRNKGTIYKGLYRKWFGVLSFQHNNRYNENGQLNNKNPLHMQFDILVSADPFL